MLKWGGVQQPLIRLKQGKRWLRAKGCENVFLGANRRDGIKTQPGGGVFLKSLRKKQGVIFVERYLQGFFQLATAQSCHVAREKPQLLPAWAKRVP